MQSKAFSPFPTKQTLNFKQNQKTDHYTSNNSLAVRSQANQSYTAILITGSIAYDEIMVFPGRFVDHFHPEKLHQINVSFALNRLERQLGGTGLNIAYNSRIALGKNQTPILLLSAVGKDGQSFIRFCRRHQISTKAIIVDKTRFSATGKVITDQQDNQIWGFYYGASQQSKTINVADYLSKKPLVVISANHPATFLHFQQQAIRLHLDYLYDPGMALTWISNEQLFQGVKHCNYLVGNDYEIAMISRRLKITTAGLSRSGVNIITTLGEKGVCYQSKDCSLTVAGYPVRQVVDPTGAGDAWRGGFIAGIVMQKPIIDCLKLGNALASFAIEKYGTVNHRPTEKQIVKRMKLL